MNTRASMGLVILVNMVAQPIGLDKVWGRISK